MTRGILVLVTNDKTLCGEIFNGGMYPDEEGCAGIAAYDGIKRVASEDEFVEFLKNFSNEYFAYDYNGEIYDLTYKADLFIMTDNENMFRAIDYIYIKNISDKPLNITDKTGRGLIVKPNGHITLNYGEYDNENSPKCEDFSGKVMCILSERQRDICENEGWRVEDLADGWVELSKYSPCGEDFSFEVEVENFADEVQEFADNFDVDEHAISWYGGNGAPSSLRTLLDDAEDIQEMIEDLARALRNID